MLNRREAIAAAFGAVTAALLPKPAEARMFTCRIRNHWGDWGYETKTLINSHPFPAQQARTPEYGVSLQYVKETGRTVCYRDQNGVFISETEFNWRFHKLEKLNRANMKGLKDATEKGIV